MNKNSDKFLTGSEHQREELVKFWQANPVIAARDIFGGDDPDWDLDKPQQVFTNAVWTHTNVLGVLSRGTGKTRTSGVLAALAGLLYPGNRIGLIGPSFRQSKMTFREIEALWEGSPIFQAATLRKPTWSPESCYIKFHAVPGRKGSWIEALPLGTDGAKIRGARFYWLFGDEGAQIEGDVWDTVVHGFLATRQNPMAAVKEMKRQRDLIAAGKLKEEDLVKPKGNKSIMTSTAYYQHNHLWKRVVNMIDHIQLDIRKMRKDGKSEEEIAAKMIMKGGDLNGQIPHRYMSDGNQALCAFTYKDMSEGFMSDETIDNARMSMSEYKFAMEYLAFFPPDTEGYYRRQMLDRAREHRRFTYQLAPRDGFIYVMGVDPAREHDNFAVAIMEVDIPNQVVNLVRVLAYNDKAFPRMHREIRRLIKLYKIEYFKCDSGGGGRELRDLLADEASCPPGDIPILEYDNEDHKRLVGKKLLGPLCEFSSFKWLEDANEQLLSGIQHKRLLIAAPHGQCPNDKASGDSLDIDEMDAADIEMEETLKEMSSIVVTNIGNRRHWDTMSRTQRKDRYSATMIAYDAALHVINSHRRPTQLATGFWGSVRL